MDKEKIFFERKLILCSIRICLT